MPMTDSIDAEHVGFPAIAPFIVDHSGPIRFHLLRARH
jgi:hypothetical protein